MDKLTPPDSLKVNTSIRCGSPFPSVGVITSSTLEYGLTTQSVALY